MISLAVFDEGRVAAAAGAGTNTLQCGDGVTLRDWPVNLLAGARYIVLCHGQVRLITTNTANTLTVGTNWTVGIALGETYAIIPLASGPDQGTAGLSYYGVVTAVPFADGFTIPTLAGLGASKFEPGATAYSAYVLRDAGGLAAAPQGESQPIVTYDTATGDLLAAAFTAAVGIGDEILLLHPSIAAAITSGVSIAAILALVSAELTLDEDNGVVTATGLGTEDNVYINAGPAGEFEPRVVKIDLDLMVGGDTTVIRYYERLTPGVAWWLMDYEAYSGIDGGLLDGVKAICVEMQPNRFGVRVTLEQTAGAVKNYQWQRLAEE